MTTPRQNFITALELGTPSGLVPHFELVFYLTMEAFGKVHPSHRYYGQWNQMEAKERQMHREEMADIYIATAEQYGHSAIFIHPNPEGVEETIRLVDLIREKTNRNNVDSIAMQLSPLGVLGFVSTQNSI